ncbi:MAG: hypothetical protein COB66_09090 [Coxiella sp. (in: Bacteria)]|nr:MAG: hypothetical protein COB66_09090 [Coxiella sp. (in: g-proteobacteria)]
MIHIFIIGLLLGWGAAIPIGPLNLEIIRRNLHFGMAAGMAIGLGAGSGDITYLVLLSAGALTILTHSVLLKVFSLIGAFILAWFGYQALTMTTATSSGAPLKQKPTWRHYLEGYALVIINPYTILFWISVSSQIAQYAHSAALNSVVMGCGVIVGVCSWSISLNLVLHHTKHKLSARVMTWLNRIGGIIILGFAIASLVHVFI